VFVRQKTILHLLVQADRALSPTVFVKLVFLLRHETGLEDSPSFYDFVPYKMGPFSFTLYRELAGLRQNGYVISEEKRVALSPRTRGLTEDALTALPTINRLAVDEVLEEYGGMSQSALLQDVYRRYPWFATRSDLPERRHARKEKRDRPEPAVYTAGYEGRSIDAFMDFLLRQGMEGIIDVRANPVSRKYGFAGSRLRDLCSKLGLAYHHKPELGVPSAARRELSSYASYQRLLDEYETTTLPGKAAEIEKVGDLQKRHRLALLCVERDVTCCHRSRLASAVAASAGLPVVHL